MKIESIPILNDRYRDNKHNIRECTNIFKKSVHIFMNKKNKIIPDLVN